MHLLRHRPDIDGLRAVAVIPVVLFHLNAGCSGGYVGVDVFFVISGYLITALILQALAEDRFTLVEFWQRRVRRIAPALTVVVCATLAAGWFLFLPDDYRQLGRSAIAQTLMAANVFFWRNAGYFDEAAELKPLLHTWSLAVEEQFYLFLPLLLRGLWHRARRAIVWVLSALCCLSLIASIPGAYWFPTATFYLLPTRAWELLLGSLLAATPVATVDRRLCEFISAGGLACIAIAILTYDENTVFPGLAALLPCAGTVAVIWSNAAHRTWTGRWLALTPVVFIGWISYSLYLWHWPLIVFARYWSTGELSVWNRGLLLVASFGLAVLSWRWIETPFRRNRQFDVAWCVFAPAGVAFASVLLASGLIVHGKGLPFRMPAEVVAFSEARHARGPIRNVSLQEARGGEFVKLGVDDPAAPIELFLWGDSHAMAVLPSLGELCQQHGVRGLAATHSAAPPLIEFDGRFHNQLDGNLPEYNRLVLDYILRNQVPHVVLVGRWSYYESHLTEHNLHGAEVLRERLYATVHALTSAGVQVCVMKEVPRHPADVPRALAKAALIGEELDSLKMPLSRHREQVAAVDTVLDSLRGPNVTVLDPVPWLLDERGYCELQRDGRVLYWDDDHLSVFGARQVRPMFDAAFAPQTAGRDLNSAQRPH